MSCQFKDIFGKPGEWVHQYRFGGIAIVDTLATALIALLISRRRFVEVFIALFILGEVLHWLFCVDTAFIVLMRQSLTLLQPHRIPELRSEM